MKKRWIALALGAAVAAGFGVHESQRLPALGPPLTIHSGGRIERLTLSPDGRLLADAAASSGQVLLYDTATGHRDHALAVRTRLMIFSPDGGRLLTMNTGASPTNPKGAVQVWDMATGAQISRFVAPAGPGAAPHFAAFSRDLRWAVVDGVAGHQVYDLAAGAVVKALPLTSGREQAVFSPDRSLLAISSGAAETLQVWDTKTWRLVQRMGSPISGVTGIRFSQDGTRLALGNKAGLAWWDTHTWKMGRRFAFPNPYGLTRDYFYFSPDGRSLLVSEVEPAIGMHQVDCGTGREMLRVPYQRLKHMSQTGNRDAASVFPGKFQYLLYRDTFCIWDTDHRKALYQVTVPPTANSPLMGDFQVHSTDLSADGHVFAAGGYDDGVIRVWRLP